MADQQSPLPLGMPHNLVSLAGPSMAVSDGTRALVLVGAAEAVVSQ